MNGEERKGMPQITHEVVQQMTAILNEVEQAIMASQTWTEEKLDDATLYYVDALGWRLQVVSLGPATLGTAVRGPIVMKLTDRLTDAALAKARAS